ncbi:MAG: ABC transporter ATP-binding protein [Bacterioplanes sp.]|nr:ABC transporter ATP-binding protein [Bacterioplanes sp.]
MSSFIEFRDVHKTYGTGAVQYQALKGVNLSVQQGEFVSLMGPSGSGKSTAMNILGCLDVLSRGEYYFQGVPVSALDRHQRALLRRHHIGFVFQGFNLLARTSAHENIELPLIYRGLSKRERRWKVDQALDVVGLLPWAAHTPESLSGGQQQRVAIARALVTSPAILLADEPTGNLDSERSVDIMQLLSTLNQEQHLTIMMVTHEPDMAQYSQRIVHFSDGRVADDMGVSGG